MFEPNRSNGAASRGRILARLRESLAHIFDAVGAELAFDRPDAAALLDRLDRNVPQPPALFSHYFDLVEAIHLGEADRAEGLLAGIVAVRPAMAGRPSLLDFSPAEMTDAEMELVLRHIALDSVEGASLQTVPKSHSVGRRRQVEEALDRIERFLPDLSGEIEETVSRFIIGWGEGESRFDGASSLAYWGGVLLNASIPKTDLQVVEMIAHEAGHNVLFGLSPAEFFVTNAQDELHPSPLRAEPRPLDGIFHATFVLARMHYAVDRLTEAGGLLEGEAEEAEPMLAGSSGNFFDALAVLEAHAAYTPTGRAIMAECAAYMGARRAA